MKLFIVFLLLGILINSCSRRFNECEEFVEWFSKKSEYVKEIDFNQYRLKAVLAGPEYCLARQYLNLKMNDLEDSVIIRRLNDVKEIYKNKFIVFIEVSFKDNEKEKLGITPFNVCLSRNNNKTRFVADNLFKISERILFKNDGNNKYYPIDCNINRSYGNTTTTEMSIMFKGSIPVGSNRLLVENFLNTEDRIQIDWKINTNSIKLSDHLKSELGLI